MTAPSPPGGPGLVANPQADLRARVELAEATLVRSTRKAKREVLAAKLRLTTKERSTQVGEEIEHIATDQSNRPALRTMEDLLASH